MSGKGRLGFGSKVRALLSRLFPSQIQLRSELPQESSIHRTPEVSGSKLVKEPPLMPARPSAAFKVNGSSGRSERASAILDLRIGLDFGTSCSKMVIRQMYGVDTRGIALPAPEHARADGDCLWATRLWIDAAGRFSLRASPGAVLLTRLKEPLMRRESSTEHDGTPAVYKSFDPREPAVAYLTLLLREARTWFETERGKRFPERKRHWSCNVGFPAASYDDEALCSQYRRVVAAAWTLTESGATIDVENVRAALNRPEVIASEGGREKLWDLGVDIIPEVVAEAHGFAQSHMRDDDLYVLLDVGASTLDVCTFVLRRDRAGLDRYAILEANVELLGADIYKDLRTRGGDCRGFKKQAEKVIKKTIWETKRCRYPGSPRWDSRLPFLVCGVGVRADVYAAALQDLDGWFLEHLPRCRLEKIDIASPDNLDVTGDPDCRRLAVAFGLSYPGNEIGGVELPGIIANVPPMRPRSDDNSYVSKDVV